MSSLNLHPFLACEETRASSHVPIVCTVSVEGIDEVIRLMDSRLIHLVHLMNSVDRQVA